MSTKKITMEYRDAYMLLNVLELHEACGSGSMQRLKNIINEGRANARGDYDLSLDDYEVSLEMRVSDWRKLAQILDQRGTNSSYDTTFIHYLIADVIERHDRGSKKNRELKPSEGPFPVFVYGTLMSGQPNNRLLTGSRLVGAVFIDESEGFEMRDLGAYPGLIESRQGGTRGAEHIYIESGKIWGELWMVDFETMRNLDRLEGLSHTNDPLDGLYYRREVDVYEDNTLDTRWTDVSVYVLGSVWSAPHPEARVPATEVFGRRQYSWSSVARRSRGWVGSGR